MKNRVIILTAALLFAMSLSAHAQIGGILDRARQVADAIDSVTSGNQTQQPTNTQSAQPQPTLDKLKFTQNRSNNPTAYNVAPANNSISGAVVIPSTYNGLPVTGFLQRGFSNITGITSVVFPDSMTSLPQSGFRGCTGLTSVTIPASVQILGAALFSDCPNLTSITFLGKIDNFNAAATQGDLYTKHRAGGAGIYTRTAGGGTWTRIGDAPAPAPVIVNTSLNGVWENSGGTRITVSGNTGVISVYNPNSALWQDAANKGYLKVGDQYWRNMTSTGNLTWTGQQVTIQFRNSSPDVAIGKDWGNATFTMSADGRTIDITGTGTWTRR